jgi:hypothetical protein
MESTLNLIAMKRGVDVARAVADLGKLKQNAETKYIIINN